MMARLPNCLLLIVSLVFQAGAQSWEFVRSHELDQAITSADVGTLGKVYLGTSRGNVYSFHADGTPDAQFSSATFQPVTCIDASNALKIFVYYAGVGKFELLDRFTAFPRSYHLSDVGLVSAELAIPAINNSIWFLSGMELVQVSPLDRMVLTRIALSGVSLTKPNQLRIIPTGFVISDENGLYMFGKSGELFVASSAKFIRGFTLDGTIALAQTDQGLLTLDTETARMEWIKAPRADAVFGMRVQAYYHFVVGTQLMTYRLKE